MNNPYTEIEKDIILSNDHSLRDVTNYIMDYDDYYDGGSISTVKLNEIMRICFDIGYKSAIEVQNNNK